MKEFSKHIYLFREKRSTIYALIFSFLLIFLNLFSFFLEDNLKADTNQILITLICSAVFMFVVAELFLRIKGVFDRFDKFDKTKTTTDKKYFVICLIILVLAYFPYLLIYFPGIFAYDVGYQMPELYQGYDTLQPLAHTLLLHLFYSIGSPNLGLFIFALLQMILFASMISFMQLMLYRFQIKKYIRYSVLVFCALVPYFSLFCISITKDVLFCIFIGVFFIELVYWFKLPEHFNKKLYVISIIGMILFRNNALYAVAAMIVLTLIFNRKFLKYSLMGLVFALIISGMLIVACSAKKGSINEIFNLPCQQIAYVYKTEGLSEMQKEDIRKVLPDVDSYNKNLSDPVKDTAKIVIYPDLFIRTYFNLMIRYPLDYFQAFLHLNRGYIYFFDKAYANIYDIELYLRHGWIQTGTQPGYGVEHISLLPQLENFTEMLFTDNLCLNIPILNILLSPALYFWIIMMFVFYSFIKRKSNFCLICFLLVYLLTVLLGPCALVRYAVPYILSIPALIISYIAVPSSAISQPICNGESKSKMP